MPKQRTDLQQATGKLISAVQKEWGKYAGEPIPEEIAEKIMDAAHSLSGNTSVEKIRELLGPRSVAEYLSESWVRDHPDVVPAIMAVEEQIKS